MNTIPILRNSVHCKYWLDQDLAALERASFGDFARIAKAIMARVGGRFHMVSGPMTSKDLEIKKRNMSVFAKVVEHLSDQGYPIFSQMPFEAKIQTFAAEWFATHPDSDYCWPILDQFYQPIFTSGLIETLHFIPGWENSRGAKWEHNNCAWWRIERRYLAQDTVDKILDPKIGEVDQNRIGQLLLAQQAAVAPVTDSDGLAEATA